MKNIVQMIMVVCISGAVFEGKVASGNSGREAESETSDTQQSANVFCSNAETKFKDRASACLTGVFLDVPEKYSGWYISKYQEGTQRQPIKIKVKQAGIVTMASASQHSWRYLTADGWREVERFTIQWDEDRGTAFIIMEKYLEEGKYEFKAEGPSNKGMKHPLLIRGH